MSLFLIVYQFSSAVRTCTLSSSSILDKSNATVSPIKIIGVFCGGSSFPCRHIPLSMNVLFRDVHIFTFYILDVCLVLLYQILSICQFRANYCQRNLLTAFCIFSKLPSFSTKETFHPASCAAMMFSILSSMKRIFPGLILQSCITFL